MGEKKSFEYSSKDFLKSLPICAVIIIASFFSIIYLWKILPGVSHNLVLNIPANWDRASEELIRTGDKTKALELLKKASEMINYSPELYNRTAMLLEQSGKTDEAFSFISKSRGLYFASLTYPQMLSPYFKRDMSETLMKLFWREIQKSSESKGSNGIFYLFMADKIRGETDVKITDALSTLTLSQYPENAFLLSRRFAEPDMKNLLKKASLTTVMFNHIISRRNFLNGITDAPTVSDMDFLPDTILDESFKDYKHFQGINAKPDWIKPPKILAKENILCDEKDIENRAEVHLRDDVLPIFKAEKITYSISLPQGRNEMWIYIIARGRPALDFYPIVEVSLDENEPRYVYADSEYWLCYPVRLSYKTKPANEKYKLTIGFANDGALPKHDFKGEKIGLLEDRNLFIYSKLYSAKENDFE